MGVSYAKNERTLAGVKANDETKSYNVGVAYNLGPVVASLNYENSYDTPASGTVTPTSGRDVSITKLKIRANY
jgi:predicted porin